MDPPTADPDGPSDPGFLGFPSGQIAHSFGRQKGIDG